MRGSVPPGAIETIGQSITGEALQPLHGNWRPRTISRQPFQPLTVFGMHRDVRMQAETCDAGAPEFHLSWSANRRCIICAVIPSYVHGASTTPLLGETIGMCLDRICEQFADSEALISRHQGLR